MFLILNLHDSNFEIAYAPLEFQYEIRLGCMNLASIKKPLQHFLVGGAAG